MRSAIPMFVFKCVLGLVVMGMPKAYVFANVHQNSHGNAVVDLAEQPQREITLECFYDGNSGYSAALHGYLDTLENRPGIRILRHDVVAQENRQQLRRLWELSKKYDDGNAKVPSFYALNRIHVGFRNPAHANAAINEMLTLRVFGASGCYECDHAKSYIRKTFSKEWPGLNMKFHDPTVPTHLDDAERARWYRISRRLPKEFTFPVFQVAGKTIMGWNDGESISKLRSLLTDGTVDDETNVFSIE